jgi:hypothetical protein
MGIQGKPGDAVKELREHFAPLAAHLGVRAELPAGDDGEARIVPQVNLNWSIGKRLARELAQLTTNCGIFLYGDRVVTVDEWTGSAVPMSSRRLGSWLEKWIETVKPDRFGELRPTTMGNELAKQVLEADQFLETLRPLKGLHPVRMPVLREDGRPELLKPGYDEASGIFTCRGVDYALDMSIEEARKVFFHEMKGFGWADIGPNGQGFYRNRSVAVQVAFMLGNYCRAFFEQGLLRPMSLIIANQPGSGKGVLAQMQLAPIYGMVKVARKPKDDSEFDKRLDTTARGLSPYLLLDDIGGGLFSNALNAFITEPVHTLRGFNTQEELWAPNVTQVIATGNQIKLTRDLDRRSLIVELHEAGDIARKSYDHIIDARYLASTAVRSRLLAAMWAFVREWAAADCWAEERGRPSFEVWTGMISGMVRQAGFADPLEDAKLGAGGDEETDAWRGFLARVAGEEILPGESGRMFSVRELLEIGKRYEEETGGTFAVDDLVGHARDASKAFGNGMKKWRAREITDTRGRTIRFGKRREASQRGYTCEVLHDPAATASE